MPTIDQTTVQVVIILFLATLVRSTFGFGEALVAVPLLALFIPVEVAAPIAALVSIVVAAVVLVQDWSKVDVRSASRLVASTVFGIPLGLMLLTMVAEPIVKAVLAIVIMAFSLHALARPKRRALKDDRLAWLFGFSAGALGGAYGMNGPPLVVYGTLRGWSPQRFRATLQGYFLPASILVVCGYAVVGLWTWTVTWHVVLALPAVIAAILLGRGINRRLEVAHFHFAVHLCLIVIAVVLLMQAATR